MEKTKRILTMVLAILPALFVQAQIESSLTFRRFVTQDGLPQMQTERLWQDSRGYIYIGTLSGFVRYDGREFTPFLKGQRINIVGFTEVQESGVRSKESEVRALGFFRQWRVAYDRLEALPLDPQGHWLLNNLNAGSLPDGYILMEDSLEQHRRLCRLTSRGFEPLIADPLLDSMTPDRKIFFNPATGEAIIPLEKGVYRIRSKGVRSKGVRSNKSQISKLSEKGDVYTLLQTDSCLLAFASDGIYKISSEVKSQISNPKSQISMQRVAEADWSAASYGLTVRTLRSGSIIVADEHSIYLCDNNSPPRLLFSGLNLIRDVLVDRWDRLWVASYQGLYCFFSRCFTNHSLSDRSDIVRAVAVNKAGQVVMGSLNGKLLVQEPTGTITTVSDDPGQFYAPSAVSIGDNVYMAGNGDMVEVRGARCRRLGLPHDRYQFVAQAWGRLITGSRNSILAYNPDTQTADTLTTAILHPWCAAEDRDGVLWVGSSSGLFAIEKAATSFRVSKTEYPHKLIISTMDADSHGNIFFASADSLFFIRRGQVMPLNAQMPQLGGHEVRAVHVSPRGYLVVAVVDGLFVCRVSKDCRLSGVLFFDRLNGFSMTEPLKATMAESADGTVWLPGVEQMTSFRPADLIAAGEADTYISPPLRWWQHWWVWALALVALLVVVWGTTRWYEKKRARRRMISLQHDINDRISLRTTSGTLVADIKDIAFFKADGNYSQIATFHGSATVLIGLGALEKRLSPDVFVRADRSTLVNVHLISSLLPKQRRCIFRSPDGVEVETTLLVPAFKRLQGWL